MSDFFPSIPKEEFNQRMSNFKKKMADNNIDIVIAYSTLCDPSTVRYFSDVSPINENLAMIIPLEGDAIVCSGQACHEWSHYNSKIENIIIMPEVGEVAGTAYSMDGQMNFEELFVELKSKHNIKKVGYIGELLIPYCITSKAEKVFSGAEFMFADEILYELRIYKSENEINCIKKAADIISSAFTYAIPRVAVGSTELDLEADLTASFLRQGAESTCYALTPMVGSGVERSTLCQARNSLRKIEEKEIISTVGGCCYNGYNGVISTPLVLGDIPKEMSDVIKMAHECLHFVADKMKPGVTSIELIDYYHNFLDGKGGFAQYSPYGAVHSIGLIECEYPFFGPYVPTVMVENMTVAIDVYLKGLSWGSFRIEDTFVIRKNGAEMLTWFNDKHIPATFK
jgi:Xaa-Pro aminopeptidase